jgi:hypothetical protein
MAACRRHLPHSLSWAGQAHPLGHMVVAEVERMALMGAAILDLAEEAEEEEVGVVDMKTASVGVYHLASGEEARHHLNASLVL